MHRVCPRCHETKELTEFGKNRRSKNGLNSYCRPCACLMRKEWSRANPEKIKAGARRFYLSSKAKGYRPAYHRRAHLKRDYGLTTDQYDAILASQGGRCAICREYETHVRHGKVTRLAVDHEYGTDRIRELLCQRCNRALGLLRDSEIVLESALAYLRKHHGLRLVDTG